MTPTTIENKFVEILKGQLVEQFSLELHLDAPITIQVPPKIIWSQLLFENRIDQIPGKTDFFDWSFCFFKNMASAQAKFPHTVECFDGRPWGIHQFMNSTKKEGFIHFKEYGTAYFSREKNLFDQGHQLHDFVLPLWLSYALSPELWGPQGKWTRFHQRIHQLFVDHDLLEDSDFPGYYPLKDKAKKLEHLGFKGSILQKTYLLVLPWSFSLSSLNKLESAIRQEF